MLNVMRIITVRIVEINMLFEFEKFLRDSPLIFCYFKITSCRTVSLSVWFLSPSFTLFEITNSKTLYLDNFVTVILILSTNVILNLFLSLKE